MAVTPSHSWSLMQVTASVPTPVLGGWPLPAQVLIHTRASTSMLGLVRPGGRKAPHSAPRLTDLRYPRPSDWLRPWPGSFACPPLGACWALNACLSLAPPVKVYKCAVLCGMLECWLGKGVIILIGWMRKHAQDTLCPAQSYTRMCPTEDQTGLVPKGLLTGDLVSHRALAVL